MSKYARLLRHMMTSPKLTYILIFNQGLKFGHRMQHSLINPNQCQAAGIDLCDDPFDPFRRLSIYDSVTDITLPIEMHGTIICSLTTRVLSNNEIENCPHIITTSDLAWDPSQFMSPLLVCEGEEWAIQGEDQVTQISQINSRINCHINYEYRRLLSKGESDLALSRFLPALLDDQNLATCTDKQCALY